MVMAIFMVILGVVFLSIVALRGLKKCGQRRLGVDMDTPST